MKLVCFLKVGDQLMVKLGTRAALFVRMVLKTGYPETIRNCLLAFDSIDFNSV